MNWPMNAVTASGASSGKKWPTPGSRVTEPFGQSPLNIPIAISVGTAPSSSPWMCIAGRAGGIARGCRAPDAAVHGTGCMPGDRGRGRACAQSGRCGSLVTFGWQALATYESTRIERATRVQSGSHFNRIVFHYPDGEEQRARDAMFASEGWSTATAWVYEYDALTAPRAMTS